MQNKNRINFRRSLESDEIALFGNMYSHAQIVATFTTGKDGQQILKAKQAGAEFGVTFRLDVKQDDYGPLPTSAGLKILIHHHETPPLVSQLGFAVSPGTRTFAAIHKQRVKH